MSLDRDGLEDRLDASALRERLEDLYARYFMPPSVSRDAVDAGAAKTTAEAADLEAFDFGAWLREGRETGPTAPPAEPRVVTGAATATVAAEPTQGDHESFDFTGWLSDGEEFEPLEALDPADDVTSEVDADPVQGTDRPHLPRPSLHPAKAATFALFLSVVALVGLTVVGSLPALGPTTGLGP